MAVAPALARPSAPVQRFRWTRERYDRMIDAGVLTTEDKVELLEGEIVPKMTQNNPHRTSTLLVGAALRSAFGDDTFVQEEKPIALSEQSEPEPDVAVIRGAIRSYLDDHPGPEAILLIVEVADSSLRRDRTHKALLYADAGIVEYWVVNLVDRVLEVHRDPVGGAYGTKITLTTEDAVSPVRCPDASIPVADLLP